MEHSLFHDCFVTYFGHVKKPYEVALGGEKLYELTLE